MPQLELKITVDDAGQIGVSGPIENKIMAYGLLEVAKEAIAEHHKKAQRIVQPATFMPGLGS